MEIYKNYRVMKKYIFPLFALFLFTNCVTQKEYDKTLNDYFNEVLKNKNLSQTLDSLKQDRLTKNENLSARLSKLQIDSTNLADLVASMQNDLDEQIAMYKKAQEEYQNKLKIAGDKNQQTNADLIQMQLDLEKQKLALQQKEKEIKQATEELKNREAKIAELKKLLEDQKNKSNALRDAIKNALTNFSAGDLDVYTKDGKVYVSMSDKLMFKSGSTAVESKGVEALGILASVIKKNPDIIVNIEGHTDNIPYLSSSGFIKDNWQLSLMRANSVLHVLTEKYQVSSYQVIASGRGEFAPKASNSTPEGRASNRRTEIILAPKVDKLLNLIGD